MASKNARAMSFFSEIGRVANNFQWGLENLISGRAAVPARFWHSEKFMRGSLTSSPQYGDWPHFQMDISFFDIEVGLMHKGVEVSMRGGG